MSQKIETIRSFTSFVLSPALNPAAKPMKLTLPFQTLDSAISDTELHQQPCSVCYNNSTTLFVNFLIFNIVAYYKKLLWNWTYDLKLVRDKYNICGWGALPLHHLTFQLHHTHVLNPIYNYYFCNYYFILHALLNNLLYIFIRVSSYLVTIILWLSQHYFARLK